MNKNSYCSWKTEESCFGYWQRYETFM